MYPKLLEMPEVVEDRDSNEEEMTNYITKMRLELGDKLKVFPLSKGEFKYKNPINEIIEIFGTKRLIWIENDN